ncbi:MAG TPA: methyltransferase [Myxococcota bacterium]|nr:methyltransferase [Myxococcota bacterium]
MSAADSARVLDLANAHWSAAALLAGAELGVFAALDADPADAPALAARTGLPVGRLRALLDALAALGLLDKDDGSPPRGEGASAAAARGAEGARYRNSAAAAALLVPGKPGSLAGALRYNAELFGAWARLADAVRNDGPVVPSPTYLGQDPARTRAFVESMHQRALGMGHAIAGAMDLAGRTHLVDVGGGPGTLAAILCRRTPGLRATVLELGPVAEVGRTLIAEQGLADRVRFVTCDVLAEDLGTGYDAALVSGLLHREPPDACRVLLRRLHAALLPGGEAHLVDVMRDATRTGPPFAALFALNMLLVSERGGCHADVDHVGWLEEAGFSGAHVRRLPAPMVHTIVSAAR